MCKIRKDLNHNGAIFVPYVLFIYSIFCYFIDFLLIFIRLEMYIYLYRIYILYIYKLNNFYMY